LFGEEAFYCRICGLDLVNKCIPEPWEDDFGGRHETVPHGNPSDMRFCEQCGTPTVYYEKSVLKGYEAVLKEFSGEYTDDDSRIHF
jgi:hypothetical protein